MKKPTCPFPDSKGFRIGRLSLLALVSLIPAAYSQTSPAPRLIPFQGRLTNQTGIAYDNGQYTITFNLYSLAIGGSTVWTERHEKVSVIGGMVNLFLGSVNTIDAVDFATTKYLGITVDADNNPATADPEMVPRTMIVPSFAAMQAERARTMDVLDAETGLPVPGQSFGWAAIFTNGNPETGKMDAAKLANESITSVKIQNGTITEDDFSTDLKANSVIPPGSVMTFAGNIEPAGWLICDGREVSRGTYARLYSAIQETHGAGNGTTTFNLPDYRGRFLRGTDSMPASIAGPSRGPAGRDVGRVLGSVQTQATARNGLSLTGTTTFATANHTHTEGNLIARISYGGNNPGDFALSRVSATTWNANVTVQDVPGPHPAVSGQTSGAEVVGTTDGPSASQSVSLGAGDTETRPINAAVNYIIKY